MQKESYQICTHCIMDSSDPNISIDERGWCDYCNNFEKTIAHALAHALSHPHELFTYAKHNHQQALAKYRSSTHVAVIREVLQSASSALLPSK